MSSSNFKKSKFFSAADVKKFFHTPKKRYHTKIVPKEPLRSGGCVTDRTAGTKGMRSPGHGAGRSHNNNWPSRAAKIFPGSEEPGKFFCFPLQPLTTNSDCAHGRQPKSPRPISAGRHVFILEPGYAPEEGAGHDTEIHSPSRTDLSKH